MYPRCPFCVPTETASRGRDPTRDRIIVYVVVIYVGYLFRDTTRDGTINTEIS